MTSIAMTVLSRRGARVDKRSVYCLDPFEKLHRKHQLSANVRTCERIKGLYIERLRNCRRRAEEERQRKLGEATHQADKSTSLDFDNLAKWDVTEESETEEPKQLWANIVRTVRLLTTSYIALRVCAADMAMEDEEGEGEEEETKKDENEVASETVKKTRMVSTTGGTQLAFRPRDYKASKERRMPESVLSILVKSPEMRTDEDVAVLSPLLLDAIPVFARYDRQMQVAMCKVIRYLKCDARHVVLRKGHVAFSTYFIFSGSVTVIVETADEMRRQLLIPLRRGSCFGDIGVIKEIERTATIVCAEDCEFLTIDKEAYIENGLDVLHQQDFETRFQFFRNWPPIVRWSDSAIRDLCSMSFTEEVLYNKVIVRDNVTDLLWFVLEGKCDVLRILDRKSCHAKISEVDWIDPWTRHYPPVTTMTFDPVAAVPDTLADVTKGTCQFQYDRVEERQRLGLKVDQTEFAKCPELKSSSPKLPDLLHHHESGMRNKAPSADGDDDVRYVRLDVLLPGDCFGLENAFPGAKRFLNPTDVLYVVSRGCRVVRTTCSKFRELVSLLGVNEPAMRAAARSYRPDREICRWIEDRRRWRRYKQDVVERTLLTAAPCSAVPRTTNYMAHQLTEGLRPGVESVDYSRQRRRVWTGRDIVGPTSNPYRVAALTEFIATGRSTKLLPSGFKGQTRGHPAPTVKTTFKVDLYK